MPDEDLTLGEIARNHARLERRVETGQRDTDNRITQVASQMVPATQYEIAHQALIDRVHGVETDLAEGLARVEKDMKAGFERIERTSQERKAALERVDAENAKAIKELRDGEATRARGRTSVTANWIAAAGVIVAVGLLIATLVTSGGR